MSFVMGLDLGQSGDPTAIGIVELVEKVASAAFTATDLPAYPTQADLEASQRARTGEIDLHLRHLERIKLGTPYPKVVEQVGAMLRGPMLAASTQLVVDATGVGRPVIDMLTAADLDPVAVTITGAAETTGGGMAWRVPKRDLVVGLQVLLQDGKLKIAKGLPEAPAFVSELLAFKVKIDAVTAHDSYNAREGAHDDLVLAVAMACWWARRQSRGWFI